MSNIRTESAVARHDRMVQEEKQQADVVATQLAPSDFWQGMAARFRPRAETGADPTLPAVAALLRAEDRLIDVGAGGGRLAIPLAAQCREVVAVEPSQAMRSVMEDESRRRGITNLVIVDQPWEHAVVEPAAVVLSANVTYGVQAIEPFLRKMDATGTRTCVLMSMVDPPQNPLAPFWQAVYGETRLRLPCSAELMDVLRELGTSPELAPLAPVPAQPLGNYEETLTELRRRLFVAPDSPRDGLLLQALKDLAEERDGLYWPPDAADRERVLITWPAHSFR